MDEDMFRALEDELKKDRKAEDRLRHDIRGVITEIHINYFDDPEHYFDVLTEYVIGMLTLSAELTSRMVLKQADET